MQYQEHCFKLNGRILWWVAANQNNYFDARPKFWLHAGQIFWWKVIIADERKFA